MSGSHKMRVPLKASFFRSVFAPLLGAAALGVGLGVACSEAPLTADLGAFRVAERSGMTWSEGPYLEPEAGHPSFDSSGFTHRSFAAFSSGGDVWFVGSVHERSSGDFAGYARRYRPGTGSGSGWAAPGSFFRRIAPVPDAADRVGLGEVAVAAAGSRGALVVFAQISPAPSTSPTPEPWVYSGLTGVEYSGVWGPALASPIPEATAAPLVPAFRTSDSRLGGPRLSLALESTGRGWLVGPLKNEAEAEAAVWTPGRGFVSATTVGVGALGASAPVWGTGTLSPYPSVQVLHDGRDSLHLFHASAALEARVLSIPSLPLPLPSVVSVASRETLRGLFGQASHEIASESGAEIFGFDSASDGEGTVWTVGLERTSGGLLRVIGLRSVNGTWTGSAQVLSRGLGLGWNPILPNVAEMPAAIPVMAQKPSIVHLGGGRFLVAFSAYKPTTLKAAVYAAYYDPSLGWSAAATVDSMQGYEGHPNIEAVTLFSNGLGGAGLAYHWSYSQGATSATIDEDVRVLRVGRFRVGQGWSDFGSATRTCSPGDSADLPHLGRRAACTHLPVGVLLPDGEAVVLHPVTEGHLVRISTLHFR